MNIINQELKSFKVIVNSFKEYPKESFLVIFSTICSGFAESIGLITFLPLLQIGIGRGSLDAADMSDEGVSSAERIFFEIFHFLNIEPTISVLLLIVFCTVVLKSFGMFVTRSYIGIVSARVATNLRIDLIKALLLTSWSYFVSQSTGRLSNAVSTEAQRASNTYLASWNMLAALLQVAMFLVISAAVSLEVLVLGCVAGVIINLLLHAVVRAAGAAGKEETVRMNSLISRLTDNISGIKPLKAMGIEGRVLPLLEGDTEGLRVAQKKQAFAAAAQQNLPQPIMVGLLVLGGWYAISFTSVQFAHLAVIALFFSRMVSRITEFQKFYQMFSVSFSAYESILDATKSAKKATGECLGTGYVPDLKEYIKLEHVSFSYEHSVNVLDDVSFEVPANALTALVGPSGSGKTTIADLITGLITADSGRVSIDGVDMRSVDTAKWRLKIGYVPQELYLFHDTIMNNVTLKDHTITEEMVLLALDRSGCMSFIQGLREGLSTVIGERGARLSGGQRQRLMIARALVRNPRLLILDEATTALDPDTEREICETIKDLSKDLTIVAISHQKTVKDFADKVVDLAGVQSRDIAD
ncbi:ABC transporter ATP-binding protein [Thalassospira sp. MIT1370]|uniref:ABC transporter ATP-binding protein n=1 Tax=unclassified Thalassospira TaxID=2648997 RepID=UPI00399A1180